tara:strand:+ start:1109 stop:1324 length:216 start_codon:yes stop_codon:yes gene_type:complete
MISKVVTITFSERPATYRLGIGYGDSGEALWDTRACRLLPPEIAFIEKADRDYEEAQKILAKTYSEWSKCK